ncbi:MAG: hypothetical protein AAF560_24980 [Acidobacteriota bacterium]
MKHARWIILAICCSLLALPAWAEESEAPSSVEPAAVENVAEASEATPAGDATLESLAGLFQQPIDIALSQLGRSCTPDPCADCWAERQCCIANCPSGNFNCIADCVQDYRTCVFTCP